MKGLFEKYKYIFISVIISIMIIFYVMYRIFGPNEIIISTDYQKAEQLKPEAEKVKEKVPEDPKEVIVYVCGAVIKPGIVSLKEGSRIGDAVDMAGGFSKNVDFNNINLAQIVSDGEKIYVPSVGEQPVSVSNDVRGNSDGKININSADESQLDAIPGVGPSTATKIIDYRNSKGKFSGIEDIKNVSGIGEKKFENIKKYIKI